MEQDNEKINVKHTSHSPSQALLSSLQWHRKTENGVYGQFFTLFLLLIKERSLLLQGRVPPTEDSSL